MGIKGAIFVTQNMTADRASDVQRSRGADRLSNGTSKLLFGDGRSAGSRRLRRVTQDLIAEATGDAATPISSLSLELRMLITRLASLTVQVEANEARLARGDALDPVGYCTVINAHRRAWNAFSKATKPIKEHGRPGPKRKPLSLPQQHAQVLAEIADQIAANKAKAGTPDVRIVSDEGKDTAS